jgi:hypothetical protein
MSKAEVEKQREDVEINRKKEEFLKNPVIVEAEKLFNSRVDKVIINKN